MVRILLFSIDNCENLPILNTELPLLTFYHTSNIDSEMINSVKINDTTLFKCLLQSGANVNAIDSKGNSALTYAAGIGNFEIIKYLIENGANVNAASPDGKTILIFAAGKKKVYLQQIHQMFSPICFPNFFLKFFSV